MNEPAWIDQLNDDYRVAVFYDDNPENPRTWCEPMTSVNTVDQLRGVIDVGHDDFPGDLVRADQELWHFGRSMSVMGYNPGGDVVKRWARIFYGITIETDHDGTGERGSWWWVEPEKMQANWPELEQGSAEYVAKEQAVIADEMRTYQQWAAGEVYGVLVERRVGVVPPSETLDIEVEVVSDEWEPVTNTDGFDNALWGCYFDDDYTAIRTARDHVDFAALGVDLTTIPEK